MVGHGTLCLFDGIDSAIRAGGEIVSFLLRINLIAWVRLGDIALRELAALYKSGHIDSEKVDEYLKEEYTRMLRAAT